MKKHRKYTHRRRSDHITRCQNCNLRTPAQRLNCNNLCPICAARTNQAAHKATLTGEHDYPPETPLVITRETMSAVLAGIKRALSSQKEPQ